MNTTHEWKPMDSTEIARFGSVVATRPAQRVSGRYTFIPTIQVVEQFEKVGFLPVKISEARATEERRGFQKHIIRFRHRDAQPVGLDGLFPEIVLTNSHDAGAAFVLLAGIFRLVCTNGQVVGEHLTGSHRVHHVGYTDAKVITAVNRISDELPRVMQRVEAFRQIEVTANDREAHALLGLVTKYGIEEVARRNFDTRLLAEPTRTADRENHLWNSANVIQEKLVEKGAGIERTRRQRGRRWVQDENRNWTRVPRMVEGLRTSRPVVSPAENVKLNQALWMLGEAMEQKIKAQGHFPDGWIDTKKAEIKVEAERLAKIRQGMGELVIALTPDAID